MISECVSNVRPNQTFNIMWRTQKKWFLPLKKENAESHKHCLSLWVHFIPFQEMNHSIISMSFMCWGELTLSQLGKSKNAHAFNWISRRRPCCTGPKTHQCHSSSHFNVHSVVCSVFSCHPATPYYPAVTSFPPFPSPDLSWPPIHLSIISLISIAVQWPISTHSICHLSSFPAFVSACWPSDLVWIHFPPVKHELSSYSDSDFFVSVLSTSLPFFWALTTEARKIFSVGMNVVPSWNTVWNMG